MKWKIKKILIAILILYPLSSIACSRISWNTKEYGTFISRTEDWNNTMPAIEVHPRGMHYDKSPEHASWTSKYTSITFTIFGDVTIEGFNEAGLSAGALSLSEESNGKRTDKKKVDNDKFVNFILDNYATVNEAIEGVKGIELYQININGKKLAGHYHISDNSGDNVVIEMIDGKIKFYHNENYNVLTNSPTFDKQIESWNSFKKRAGENINSSTLMVPGNTSSSQRFIRNKFFQKQLKQPNGYLNGIAKLSSTIYVMPMNIAKLDPEANIHGTEFIASYSLEEKLVHVRYQNEDAFSHFYVSLDKLNDGNFYRLDIDRNANLFGDVAKKFEKH
ncbi:linear amide C-N hydrolase [Vibrio owensii]|uniref:linear amide C-N hydrolase n=1 Tax=Vibrio owensii TaxID=696485 RepID=UPI003AB0234E